LFLYKGKTTFNTRLNQGPKESGSSLTCTGVCMRMSRGPPVLLLLSCTKLWFLLKNFIN